MSDYIVVIGTNAIDKYYEMDVFPVMGDKTICTEAGIQIGGMLANAATVYAGYGSNTYMIDYLDDNADADSIVDALTNAGVDTTYITRNSAIENVVCLIMIKDGERVIFVMGGNKKNLLLSDSQRELITNARYVYTSLSELSVFADEEDLISTISNSQAELVLDLEGGTLQSDNPNFDFEIIKQSKFIFVNQGGHEKLKSLYGEEYVATLNKSGCTVIRTFGSYGCAVYADGKEITRQPGIKVKAIDTTGAGDTFNASFLYGLSQNWAPKRCAAFANGAAARSVTIFGPRSGVTSEQDVLRFIERG